VLASAGARSRIFMFRPLAGRTGQALIARHRDARRRASNVIC
jgi:hypothetical protein